MEWHAMQEKISFEKQMAFVSSYVEGTIPVHDERLARIEELQSKQIIAFLDEFLNTQPGKELETTQIGYFPLYTNGDSTKLAPKEPSHRELSRYRLVYGPVDFYLGGSPSEIHVITACAPNLSTSAPDLAKFYPNLKFQAALYEKECKKLADFIVGAAKNGGHDKLIMPTFGLGVYLNTLDGDSKLQAKKAMYAAFAAAAEEKGIVIDWVIWAGTNREEYSAAMQTQATLKKDGFKNINPIVHKDMIEYTQECKYDKQNVVMLNPGSDRTIGGQYHVPNKKTLEEQIAQTSDLLFLHSSFNQPMVEQFQKDIKQRRSQNIAPVTNSPNVEPVLPATEIDLNALKNSMTNKIAGINSLSITILPKGTKNRTDNYKFSFSNTGEAQAFLDFLTNPSTDNEKRIKSKKIQQPGNFIVLTPTQLKTLSEILIQTKEQRISPQIEVIKPNIATITHTISRGELSIHALTRYAKGVTMGQQDKNGDYKLTFKRNEDAAAFSQFLAEGGIRGQKGEPKAIQKEGSSPFIMLTTKQFEMFAKIREITYAISQQTSKFEKQNALKQCVNKANCSVMELGLLYNILKKIDGLNTHSNYYTDRFFGIEKTASWQATLGELREAALNTLFNEVKNISTTKEKKAFLEAAKTLALFSEHRHNSVFTGAWGKTASVKKIEEAIEQLEQSQSSLPSVKK